MKTDEQDDLWRLLGSAKAPTISPFFSRNVLRAIREQKQEKPGLVAAFNAWLNWRWVTLGASTCLLLVIAGFAFHHPTPPPQSASGALAQAEPSSISAPSAGPQQADPVNALAQQVSTSPDYQVINHLDELLASEETSVWLEK